LDKNNNLYPNLKEEFTTSFYSLNVDINLDILAVEFRKPRLTTTMAIDELKALVINPELFNAYKDSITFDFGVLQDLKIIQITSVKLDPHLLSPI
jgi:hypothetical protein